MVASTGWHTFLKYVLFSFNFVFWVSGIGIIAAGATIEAQYKQYMTFLDNKFMSAPILLIVVGCGIAVVGFLGCCGAMREDYCMMITFAFLLSVVFVMELAAGGASYMLKNELGDVLKGHADASVTKYGERNAQVLTGAWDKLQETFGCCGVVSYKDWTRADVLKLDNAVPDSCCLKYAEKCGYNQISEGEGNGTIYKQGCLDDLQKWVLDNVATAGGVGVGIAFLQIAGVILSCCFAMGIDKNGYEDLDKQPAAGAVQDVEKRTELNLQVMPDENANATSTKQIETMLFQVMDNDRQRREQLALMDANMSGLGQMVGEVKLQLDGTNEGVAQLRTQVESMANSVMQVSWDLADLKQQTKQEHNSIVESMNEQFNDVKTQARLTAARMDEERERVEEPQPAIHVPYTEDLYQE